MTSNRVLDIVMPNATAAKGLMAGVIMLLKDHALRAYVLDEQEMDEKIDENALLGEEAEEDDYDEEEEAAIVIQNTIRRKNSYKEIEAKKAEKANKGSLFGFG